MIVYYLISKKDKSPRKNGYRGLIVNPTDFLALNSFVGANLYGLWGHGGDQYPSCVKSCTGFVITLGGATVTWVYKIHK